MLVAASVRAGQVYARARRGETARVEKLADETEREQLCCRCAPRRHVQIPFVVLVARWTPARFPFQLPGPLGPLTFRARPLINQSDEKGAKIKYK